MKRLCCARSAIIIMSLFSVLFLPGESVTEGAQIDPQYQKTVLPGVLLLLLEPETVADVIKNVDLNDYATEAETEIDPAGRKIALTKMMIAFKPEATPLQFENLLDSLNATITSSVARTRSVVVRIPKPDSLEAYYALINQIETEPFVDFVWKGEIPKLDALPSIYQSAPPDPNELLYIDNHLAIRAHAAWNASRAIDSNYMPMVVVADTFGQGPPENNTVNFINYGGFRTSGWEGDHGYAVLGIITGTHGQYFTTGIYPGTIGLGVVDHSDSGDNLIVFPEIMNKLLTLLISTPGEIIVNTSTGYVCDEGINGVDCIDISEARAIASLWVEDVRLYGLENRVLHVTSAGNIEKTGVRYARTNSPWASAALLEGLTSTSGHPLANLKNTVVVENAVNRTVTDTEPVKTKCLYQDSFIGGHVSGIGTYVRSFDDAFGEESDGHVGTSFSSPQVAGLAAYLWSIDHTLSPQQIKNLLIDTSDPVPVASEQGCSDSLSPAPIVDAYEALLALDAADSHPVRSAILDVTEDNSFNENDLQQFVNNYYDTSGPSLVLIEPDVPDYGRYDLNGDGWTGGSKNTKFDLNMDLSSNGEITQYIGGDNVGFNEYAASDVNVLCYYAYSNLYSGDTEQRDDLIGRICGKEECRYGYSPYDINYGYYKICRQSLDPRSIITLVHTIDYLGFDSIILKQEVCNEAKYSLTDECQSVNSLITMNWSKSYPGPGPSILLIIDYVNDQSVYKLYKCLPTTDDQYDLMDYSQGAERLGTYSTLEECDTVLRTYIPQNPSVFVYPGTCHDWWDHLGETCTY
jgi:hypothetical protein